MNKLFLTGMLAMWGLTHHYNAKKYVITNFNITFAPDLSNRVNPALFKRPLIDPQLLRIVTADFSPSVVFYHRSQNQKDKLTVDFINKGLIGKYQVNTAKFLIDLGDHGRFPDQLTRISYLKNYPASKIKIDRDVSQMNVEFNRVYGLAARDNVGADIWTYFDQGIGARQVLEDEKPVVEEELTYVNHYRNILILPTDGYIEAGIFGKGFDLSQQTIDKFRNAFLASGENDLEHFFKKNKAFRIRPVHNPYLRNLEVLVLELFDRSLTASGSATTHPTDQEIIKLFWTDWFKASGVKRFELNACASSAYEAEKTILTFLQVDKK